MKAPTRIRVAAVALALVLVGATAATAGAASPRDGSGAAIAKGAAKAAKAKPAKPASRAVATWEEEETYTVSGAKYEDLNGDGDRDAGEPGLAGWTIKAYVVGGPIVTTATDAKGDYAFELGESESATVCEVLPAGWEQTGPGNDVCADASGVAAGGYEIGDGGECATTYDRRLQWSCPPPEEPCGGAADRRLQTETSGDLAGCDFGNRRLPPRTTITVVKVVYSAKGQVDDADPGRFDLEIDGVTAGTGGNVGNGGTTGPVGVDPGSHTVGESARGSTNLDDYVTTVECELAEEQEQEDRTLSGSQTERRSVELEVADGDHWLCTITNARKPTGGGGGGGGGGGTPTPPTPTPPAATTPAPTPQPDTAAPAGIFKPPVSCRSLTASVKTLRVGKKTAIRVVIRGKDGKPIKGRKVTIRGAGVSVSAKTNAKGVAIVVIRPAKPGILTIAAGGSCARQLGVSAGAQPPLTG